MDQSLIVVLFPFSLMMCCVKIDLTNCLQNSKVCSRIYCPCVIKVRSSCIKTIRKVKLVQTNSSSKPFRRVSSFKLVQYNGSDEFESALIHLFRQP